MEKQLKASTASAKASMAKKGTLDGGSVRGSFAGKGPKGSFAAKGGSARGSFAENAPNARGSMSQKGYPLNYTDQGENLLKK